MVEKQCFIITKGQSLNEGECVLLKATIAEHRLDKYERGKPLTYLNRVTVLENKGTI